MRIALVIPQQTFDWQGHIIRELIALRHEVLINDCDEKCDVLLGMTHTHWTIIKELHEKYPNVPMITLNWDWYDYIDKTQDGWPEFTQLMKESKEVWTSSKAEADKCEKDTGIKSNFYTYAFIKPWEFEEVKRDLGFAFMASRKDKNKRFHWFVQACEELGIPYKKYHPHDNSRIDYVTTMQKCGLWVLASREESIGGLGTMEASYCDKPCLISDCAGNKEVWGDNVYYFKRDDFEDFKKQLEWLWENRDSKEVSERVNRAHKEVEERFLPWIIAKKYSDRLKEIL